MVVAVQRRQLVSAVLVSFQMFFFRTLLIIQIIIAGNAISMTGKGAQSIQITDLKSAMRANKMLADEVT